MSNFKYLFWLIRIFNYTSLGITNSNPKANVFTYQQVTCTKSVPTSAAATNSSLSTNTQITKQFESFTDFMRSFNSVTSLASVEGEDKATATAVTKLISCLICGAELKFAQIDILKHFQCEHEFNILLNLNLTLDDLEIIHTLQLNNYLQLCQGKHLFKVMP